MTLSKFLYLAWQCPATRSILPVGRLVDLGEAGYEFAYIQAVHAAMDKGFAPLLAFPKLDVVYRSAELPALFRNRVMSSARPDYPAFVQELGLEEVSASPMEILARSGGRRATDELEVFTPPTTRADGSRFIPALVRAVRHVPGADEAIASLQPGDLLLVTADFQNDKAGHALLLRTADARLVGYLPDYLAAEVAKWPPPAQSEIQVVVERVNPEPAPTSHRLLGRVELPAGQDVLKGEEYLPLPPGAVSVAA